MKSNFTKIELQEIENQLKCPTGELGLLVAENMNISNYGMTLNALEALNIQNADSIMELGPANCGHLSEILNKANDLNYCGLDISETMVNEAQIKNQNIVKENSIYFKHYDGGLIPFPDTHFDKIFSVNTIYFWEAPIFMLNELYRVIKPKGLCAIAFAAQEFLRELPYVGEKFNLFELQDINELVEFTSFEILDIESHSDEVKSNKEEFISRNYYIVILSKS